MTSFAFIMGVLPLVFATGAGAEMRRVMGIAVFSGMLGVTFLGLVFTPLFYVRIRGLVDRHPEKHLDKPVAIRDDVKPIPTWRPPLVVETDGGSHVSGLDCGKHN